jgi:hypothetical protein
VSARAVVKRRGPELTPDEKTVLESLRKFSSAVPSENISKFAAMPEGRLSKALNALVRRRLVIETPSARGGMFPNYKAAQIGGGRGAVTGKKTKRVASRKMAAKPTVLAVIEAAKSPVLVDDIAAKTGLSTGAALAELTMLEIGGKVKVIGDRYAPATRGTKPGPDASPTKKAQSNRKKSTSRGGKPSPDAKKTSRKNPKLSASRSTDVTSRGAVAPRVSDSGRTVQNRALTQKPRKTGIVEVEICSKVYRDLSTGQFVARSRFSSQISVLRDGQKAARKLTRKPQSGAVDEMEYVDGIAVSYSYNPNATSTKNLNLRVKSLETPKEFADGMRDPATSADAKKAWAFVQGSIRAELRERLVAELTGKAISSAGKSETAKRAATTRKVKAAMSKSGTATGGNTVTRDEAARLGRETALVRDRVKLELQRAKNPRTEARLRKRVTRLNAWVLQFQKIQRGAAYKMPAGYPRKGLR